MSENIRETIQKILIKKYGRSEEELITSGLIDSLKAVQLALDIEQEFGLEPGSFGLNDMSTISSLAKRISEVQTVVA